MSTVLLSLSLLCSPEARAGGLPDAEVAWRRGAAVLTVAGPAGEHVQREAPASGWVEIDGRRLAFTTDGAALVDGLVFAAPGDERVLTGQLHLSLCEDGGTACRIVDAGLLGTLEGRRGKVRLAVHPPASPAPEVEAHAALPADEAFARAAAEDKLVLLDFSATWCPPCNLMAAEVLHDPEDAPVLEPFALALVDVDTPESWTLKDRYHVGGYPTLVVARPDGALVDQLVGYPGEARTIAWLATLGQRPALAELPDPATVSPEQAAELALRLVRADRTEDAAPWMDRAAGVDSPAARLARVQLEATAEDVLWLAAHDRENLAEWLWPAMSLALTEGTAPEVGEAVLDAARRGLQDATPIDAADLLYASGRLTEGRDPASARLLFAAAAASLESGLSGDLALDRGYLSSLADLYQRSGDLEKAVEVLGRGTSAWPHDFTFFYATASLLVEAEQPERALPFAVAALALSYGDNRLRAARVTAMAMAAAGQAEPALALIDRTLAEAERPAEGTDVRTPRYLQALEKTRAELAAAP